MNEVAQTNGGIHPAIADHYEGMNAALYQRDKLKETCTSLQNKLEVALGTIDRMQLQLDDTTRQRDHYMRQTFALTSRLNSVQDIIGATLDLAVHEANNPSPPMPKAATIEAPDE